MSSLISGVRFLKYVDVSDLKVETGLCGGKMESKGRRRENERVTCKF